jgi:hypothetical protein
LWERKYDYDMPGRIKHDNIPNWFLYYARFSKRKIGNLYYNGKIIMYKVRDMVIDENKLFVTTERGTTEEYEFEEHPFDLKFKKEHVFSRPFRTWPHGVKFRRNFFEYGISIENELIVDGHIIAKDVKQILSIPRVDGSDIVYYLKINGDIKKFFYRRRNIITGELDIRKEL